MKNIQTDIVIIGAGPAGLAAAYEACARGKKVLLLEKGQRYGGVSGGGMGMFAVESSLQKAKLLSFSKEDAFRLINDYTHGNADARLVSAYLDKSADTIDWFLGMGALFSDVVAYYEGAQYTWHMYAHENELRLTDRIVRQMDQRGFDYAIRLGTGAREILKEAGRVCGVLASDADGDMLKVSADAVIVATGGIGGNREAVKEISGLTPGENLFTMDISSAQGDGIRMVRAAGGKKTRIDADIYCGLGGTFGGPGGVNEMLQSFRQPNLMVNYGGERFMNEENMKNGAYAANGVRQQEKFSGFMIFSDEIEAGYRENGWDLIMNDLPARPADTDALVRQAMKEQPGWLFAADSIAELARETGICAGTLEDTLSEYNDACDSGRDVILYKTGRFLKPVRGKRFYAGRFVLNGYGTLGGITINYKTQVLDEDMHPIPGLYAAGNDANTLFGDSYPFMLSGNTSGFAYNTGRMAGEYCAEYVDRLRE